MMQRIFGRLRPLCTAVVVSVLASLVLLGCSSDSPPIIGSDGEEKPRVLVLHSYDNGFRWTAEQQEGIVEGLEQGGYSADEIELRTFYMDTRVNFLTEEQITVRTEIARRTIDEFAPELVIVTDDTAVEQVALPYLAEHPDSTVSFVFSGVNGDPATYPPVQHLEAPGAKITGLVERIPFTEGLEAAVRVFNQPQRVVIFADDSVSSGMVRDGFRQSLLEGNAEYAMQVIDFIQISTYEDWKQKVSEYAGQVDVIGVVNYHRVKDQSGNIVPPRDVAKWMMENSTVPVFGLISDWAADGLVMAFGNAGFETGVAVGRRGAEVLAGRDAGTMPIIDPHLYEITFNQTAIDYLKLEIPASELDKAREIFE